MCWFTVRSGITDQNINYEEILTAKPPKCNLLAHTVYRNDTPRPSRIVSMMKGHHP